jgi:uncharacterized protein (UPF0335 family)
MPSFNLQRYLTARASGASVEEACAKSGIGMGEAELHEADIASGEMELPHVHVHAREGDQRGEDIMADETLAGDELRLLIERIERLAEERKGIADDIAEVYGEAKARGYDTAAMKRVIKLRKMEPHTRQEAEAILALYLSAVGLSDTEETVALAVAA